MVAELEKGAKAGPIIAGIFFIIPLFWCYGPKGEQNYILEEKNKGDTWIINDSEKKLVINDHVIEKGMSKIDPGSTSLVYGDESLVFEFEAQRVYLIKEKDRLSK